MALSWLRRSFPLPTSLQALQRDSGCVRRRPTLRLLLERLEDRLVPASAIWTGGGLNNLWSNAANWEGNVAPQSGDDLVFAPGAGQLNNVNDFAPATEFRSITFTGTGYTVGGHLILLSGGITANFVNGQSAVNFNIGLTAPQSFNSGFEQTTLTIGGAISLAAHTLTVDGQGIINLSGAVDGDQAAKLMKEGIGRTNATGVNQFFLGDVVINNGELLVNNAFGLGPNPTLVQSGNTTVNAGGTLGANGGGTWTENIVLRGAGFGGSGTIDGFASTNFLGNIVLEAHSTIGTQSGVTLTVLNGAIVSGPFDLTKVGPGTLALQSPNTYTGNTTVNGGGLTLNTNGRIESPTITLNYNSILSLDYTSNPFNPDRLSDAVNLVLNASQLSVSGRSATSLLERVGMITLGQGHNNITVVGQTASGSHIELRAGSLVRNPGTTLNFTQTNLSLGTNTTNGSRVEFDSPMASYIAGSASIPGGGGGIIPWATVNNTEFATYGTGGTITDGIVVYSRATGAGIVPAPNVGIAPLAPDYSRSIGAVANPALAPGFTPTGGGLTGGLLAAGSYFVRFTFVNSVGETAPSPVTANITVNAGEIPRVVLPAPAVGATGYNVYLSNNAATPGSEQRYNANRIAATTGAINFDLSAAAPGGVVPPGGNSTAPNADTNVRITASETLPAGLTTINSLTAVPSGNITVTIPAGATLSIDSGGLLVASSGTLTFTGGGVVNFNGLKTIANGAFIFANVATTINAPITGPTLATGLAISGSSTLQFGGNTANTYVGTTFVNSGTLVLNKTLNILSIPGNLVVGDGGNALDVVQHTTAGQININANVLVRGPARLTFPNNVATGHTIGSLTMMAGANTAALNAVGNAIVETGTGGATRLNLGSANTVTVLAPLTSSFYFAGISTITGSGGTIGSVDLIATDRTFTVADGAASVDLDMNALVQGSGGLVKTGSGNLLFRANNTYSGPTSVVAGTVTNNSTLVPTSQTNVLSGGTIAGGVGTTNGFVNDANVNIGFPNPLVAPTVTVTGGGTTGGTLSGGIYFVNYTFVRNLGGGQFGETPVSPSSIPFQHGMVDPTTAATVNPLGGTTGGMLAASTVPGPGYFIRYTFVDNLGGETLASPSFSFPVPTQGPAVNSPQVTLPPVPLPPPGVSTVGYNIYLSDPSGTPGSERKYNTSVIAGSIFTTTTIDLVAAAPPGGTPVPTINTTGHGIPQVTLPPLPAGALPGTDGYNIYLSNNQATAGSERKWNTTLLTAGTTFNLVNNPSPGAPPPISNTTAAPGSHAFVSPGPVGNPNGFAGQPIGTTVTTRGILRSQSAMSLNPGTVVTLELATPLGTTLVPGTDYDQLVVGGTLTIAPGVKLIVDLAGFNLPEVGDNVTYLNAITFANIVGQFSVIETINNPFNMSVFLQPNVAPPGAPTAFNLFVSRNLVPAPPSIFAVAPAKKWFGDVEVYDGVTKQRIYTIKAFPKKGPMDVAVGDVNGDQILDIIASQLGVVRVFDGTTGLKFTTPIGQFRPFGKGYKGYVFLAAGNTDGTAGDEIIAGRGTGKAVYRVFQNQGANPPLPVAAKNAYPGATTGVRVASGDFDNDGDDDIYTAPGPKRRFDINVYDQAGTRLNGNPMQPYGASYKKGGFIAVGDIIGNDGRADVLVGPGLQKAIPSIPVAVLNAATETLATSLLFQAFNPPGFEGPIRVALTDADADGILDAFVARGNTSKEVARWDFNAPTGPATPIDSFFALLAGPPFYNGGLAIAGGVRGVG